MLTNLIHKLDYFSLNTYEILIGKLVDTATTGNLNDFMSFEIALANVKKQRDSLSDNERKIIFKIFEDKSYPREVLSGEYLDELEKIVLEANLVIRDSVNDGGEKINYEEEEMQGVAGVCFEGIENFKNYMDNSVLRESYTKMVEEINPLAREFLGCIEKVYEELFN